VCSLADDLRSAPYNRRVSAPRFLVPDIDPSRTTIALPADESHHLARVLRLRAGDEIVVFDGRGHARRARVTNADHRQATAETVEALPDETGPPIPISLVQSVLKMDKMDDVVRDATMAGATRIVPVVTARSQVRAAALLRSHAEDRWKRIAIASAKQCGRALLPHIAAPRPFGEWLAEPFEGVRLLLAEPEAAAGPIRRLRDVLQAPKPSAIACIVGPEGGWPIEELQDAERAGCIRISLGPSTLRADAAGLVAVSVLSFLLSEI
jgi:16S rRNA (uracil1498-N3)-methyltransferase